MPKNYYASICYEGIHGGAVKLTTHSFIFRCQKITVPDPLHYLEIPYKNIAALSYQRKFFLFPLVTVRLQDGSTYCFLIFHVKSFLHSIKP